MLTADELKSLIDSGTEADKERLLDGLVQLLTSPLPEERRRGCELFEEGLGEALFRSCLNYGALVRGVTHPLAEVMTRTVEHWAAARDGDASAGLPRGRRR